MITLTSNLENSISQPDSTQCDRTDDSRPRTANILVTDCGRGSAIAIIRALHRRGWNVIAGDCVRQNVRFASRCASRRFLYPAPKEDPSLYVAQILAAVQRWDIDLIVPVTDESLLPLSQARDRFPKSCQLAIPNSSSLELTTNKLKTIDLAERLGVPVPRTAVVSNAEEAVRVAEHFQWPIVLKPLVSRLYRDGQPIHTLTVSYANSLSSLADQIRGFEGLTSVLLQEFVQGVGNGVELLTRDGEPVAAFQHKRLREVPITGGASSLRKSVPVDPVLYDYSLRLMRELRWTGLAMVEFKVGQQGPKLMEINGRVWGSLPLAVHSGVDFPGKLVDLYLNPQQIEARYSLPEYDIGVCGRNLELDITWMLAVLIGKRRFSFLPMPKRAAAIKAVLGLLNPRIRFDIQSLRDPLPGIAELLRIGQKLLKKSRDARA